MILKISSHKGGKEGIQSGSWRYPETWRPSMIGWEEVELEADYPEVELRTVLGIDLVVEW